MPVWNVLHAARWIYRTQKGPKNWPSAHHCTTLSGYIFAIKAHIDNRKICQTAISPSHVPQYGELWPTNGWDLLASLGHPSKFQRVISRLGFVTAATSLNQTLQGVWPSSGLVHYVYIFRAFAPYRNFATCKIHFRPSLAFSYIGSVTARHSISGRQRKFAASYKEWNYGTFADGAIYSTAGRPSRWASAHMLVIGSICFPCLVGLYI